MAVPFITWNEKWERKRQNFELNRLWEGVWWGLLDILGKVLMKKGFTPMWCKWIKGFFETAYFTVCQWSSAWFFMVLGMFDGVILYAHFFLLWWLMFWIGWCRGEKKDVWLRALGLSESTLFFMMIYTQLKNVLNILQAWSISGLKVNLSRSGIEQFASLSGCCVLHWPIPT